MMATYYSGSGSDMQAAADGGSNNIQTLYLMNPNFSSPPYHPSSSSSDTHPPPPPNMLLFNQQPHALNPSSLPHAPPILSPSQHQHQHLLGIPLVGSSSPQPQQDDLIRPSPSSTALYGGLVPRVQYNLWAAAAAAAAAAPTIRDDHSSQAHIPTAIAVTPGGVDVDVAAPSSIGFFRRPPPPHVSVSTSANNQPQQLQSQQGGLSLSLNNNNNSPRINSKAKAAAAMTTTTEGVVLGSKYLKPVQELLDEVVSAVDLNGNLKYDYKSKTTALGGGDSGTTTSGKNMMIGSSGGSGVDEISTAALQRQQLQINKANLLNMLDEVDRRYRQYHSQMQTVVASFEKAAGPGSARCYTALALGTISRQFRSLKDAVASQLKATTNALGSEVDHQRPHLDVSGSSTSSIKRRGIRLVDYPNHNPWRPQRGLPERAVSVLRAWLFEHFLHPYPKDGDKHMLAKQTGLTRSQVSNWFINARVRLWKPMVEEMYLEETKAQQHNANDDGHPKNQSNSTTPNVNNINSNNINSPTTNLQPSTASLLHPHLNNTNSSPAQFSPEPALAHSTSVTTTTTTTFQGFSMIRPSSEMDSIFIDPKRPRTSVDMQLINSPNSIISAMETEMKPPAPDQLFTTTGPTTRTAPIHASGGLFGGSYPFGEIGPRFDDDNGPTDHQLAGQGSPFLQGNSGSVSLTLGLPHSENQQLSHPRQHQHGGVGGFISPAQNNIQLGSRRPFGGEMEIEEDAATDHHHFFGISTSVSAAGQDSQSVGGGGGAGGGGGGGFDWIDLQNRKRFAAVQLLSDFVT